MRLLPLLLLLGCSCPDTLANGGIDAGDDVELVDVSSDVPDVPDVFDGASFDAPGLCAPAADWSRDRFAGDSQAIRDAQHAESGLFMECSIGEGCGAVTYTVDDEGVVSSVDAVEGDVDQPCAEAGLLDLCLPSLAGGSHDASACGI